MCLMFKINNVSAFVCVCSRVVAENDFLHTLLNKVTASRGDSGGQGTVPSVTVLLELVAQYAGSHWTEAVIC